MTAPLISPTLPTGAIFSSSFWRLSRDTKRMLLPKFITWLSLPTEWLDDREGNNESTLEGCKPG
jgi:hypothetical protein